MAGLTPASASGLPPLGELVADDPFWRYPSSAVARDGAGHLRVWLTAGTSPGYLAVVTETGLGACVTRSAVSIWAELARRYGPALVLLEHYPAAETEEAEGSLDLVRLGADGQPHWTRVWPTDEGNPRHAALEAWMASYGDQIINVAADEAG